MLFFMRCRALARDEQQRDPAFLKQMVRRLAKEQRLARSNRRAKDDERCAFLFGLGEDRLTPIFRRAAPKPDGLVTALGDLGKLSQGSLLMTLHERPAAKVGSR